MPTEQLIIITGPTCSGKTKVAIDMAIKNNGEIINADSLQCFEDLNILTACPLEKEKQDIPHYMYQYLPYNARNEVMEWAKLVTIKVKDILTKNKTPIIVGGTGFYIKTLLEGISPLPSISEEIRLSSKLIALSDYEKLCNRVYDFDPKLKFIIKPSMHHQMIRAFEVMTQTGQSIRHFFMQPKIPFLQNECNYFIVTLERNIIYERINKRFNEMLKNGAIDQVEKLIKKTKGSTDFPIFNAVGAIQIAQYLNNEISLDKASNIAKQLSRNYAKRQITWFKNQAPKKAKILTPIF